MNEASQSQPVPEHIIYDDLETIRRYTGMGRTAIYAAIREQEFPQPYQLGKRLARWKRTEVLDWLESRPRGTRLTPADKARQREARV